MKHFFAAASVVWLAGCASFGQWAPGLSTNEVEVIYARDAEGNMAAGDAAMQAKNYPEAARFYEFVKTKYPYLESAKTAELRLGDAEFERERYIEARDRYQNFVRLHPTHPQVDYAAFRGASTHYKEIPSDFFLLPPASEKDQVEVKNALSSMVEFTRSFPDSSYVPEAQKVIVEVKRRLADHELYVAGFYAKRDRWPAVVTRLSTVVKNYDGTGYEEQVYFGLYDAYRQLKDETRALETLRTYVSRHPKDRGVPRAEALLKAAPVPAPAAPPPPATGGADAGT